MSPSFLAAGTLHRLAKLVRVRSPSQDEVGFPMHGVRPEHVPNRCAFEKWSVAEIVDAYSGKGDRRFVLPPFQRDFVWKSEQQRGFIESVRDKLPVGALLLLMPRENPQFAISSTASNAARS
jgi:hypothetical protein